MNDEFLYDLRTPPSRAFAAQLKARLDIQASYAQRQRRAVKWFTLGAIFMGSVALAFLSPAVQEGATALVPYFRAAPPSGSQRQAAKEEPRARSLGLPNAETLSSGALSATSNEPRQTDLQSSTPAEMDGSLVTNHPNSSAGSGIISSVQKSPTVRIAYTKRLDHLVERLIRDVDALEKINVTTAEVPANVNPCARDFDPTIGVVLTDRRLSADRQIHCSSSSLRFVELTFVYDAIVIITNAENTWARALSLSDFHKVRDSHPSNPITTWSQVRPEWPTLPMVLVGTALESRLGSRFANAVGLSHGPSMLTISRDDDATFRSVANNLGAVGYIDFGTYHSGMQNRSAWPPAAALVNATGESVMPTVETIQARKYELSRPIYLYFKVVPPHRGEVYGLLDHLLRRSSSLSTDGYVALGPEEMTAAIKTIREARTGVLR